MQAYFWSGLKPGSSVTIALLLPNLCVIITPVTCSATTSLGIGIALVVPSPSWPSSLSPHVNTSPWSLQATQWSEPITKQQLVWHIICHRCCLSPGSLPHIFPAKPSLAIPSSPHTVRVKKILTQLTIQAKILLAWLFSTRQKCTYHKTEVHLPILMWPLCTSTHTIT
jgi:hypothetical protein